MKSVKFIRPSFLELYDNMGLLIVCSRLGNTYYNYLSGGQRYLLKSNPTQEQRVWRYSHFENKISKTASRHAEINSIISMEVLIR